MIEFDTVYKPGRRTFIYLFITYGWWLVALGIAFGYLAFAMYFGSLNAWTSQFLSAHPSWYVSVGMLSIWTSLIAFAFLFIGYLRASVQYRRYSFYVDDHAFQLQRGVIRVQEITIPYKQISNVHIEQPYHWRLLGLAQLDITISSSRNAFRTRKKDFLIPCIDKSLARALSQFLIKQASGETDEEDEFDDEDDAEDISIEH